MSSKSTTQWISDKLHGGNPPTPPDTASQRRDKTMASAVSAKLQAGPQGPTDTLTPGDQADAQANDAASIEDEARGMINDQDVLDAADDPTDELHALAVRLLKACVAIVTLERKKAAQP